MTSEDFIKEVKSSDLYYEYFEEEYKDFQEYQSLALKTLNEFHRICEKNEINYAIGYGSLLGAIRDHGQIPWDYDIDVLISIQDRERLITALNNDLSDEFYYMSPEVDQKCRHYFIKMAPKGYKSLELHVDVFYLVGLPNDEVESKKIQEILKRNTKIRRIKCRDLRRDLKVGKREFLLRLYLKIRFLFASLKKKDAEFEEAAHRYPMDQATYCCVPEYKSVLKVSDILDTTIIKLATGNYRIPVNYQVLLAKWYGDYMRIMPLNERLDEMRTHYKYLNQFAKDCEEY